ncbi:hypothetical protein [Actinoplanes derwentensis]|uniref:Uncharacterized protein n=1 Tax=Actinoplanes derwentensis TaxID=113562 RepID=A0A1H2CUM1_9ACTN|nr:hypothetical protein [Actinoplanes derwentensis]GID81966.1 hypothetical protein Ade03nite_08900 [Actinoplanes derwentensis]SDT74228.1 hypothetical protein SAMN04489716_6915 [Actinoplanes derwentensis]
MTEPGPPLTTDQVRVAYDRDGHQALLVPDEVAARIRAEITDGWSPHFGTLPGPVRVFTSGTWTYTTVTTIMWALAACPIPEGLGHDQYMDALTNRFSAAHGLTLWPPIISADDWNEQTRTPDAPVDPDLHVVGPHLCPDHAIAFKRAVKGD